MHRGKWKCADPQRRRVSRADRVTGEVLGEKVVWQLIKPYAEAAGVPGIAPHDLRRTCLSCAERRW